MTIHVALNQSAYRYEGHHAERGRATASRASRPHDVHAYRSKSRPNHFIKGSRIRSRTDCAVRVSGEDARAANRSERRRDLSVINPFDLFVESYATTS